MNGHSHLNNNQQFQNRPGGSLQNAFNNVNSGPPGLPARPPGGGGSGGGGGGGNPYVPAPPMGFALAPSRGRPPSGPRANGPGPGPGSIPTGPSGPGGPGGMLPRRPNGSHDPKPNGSGAAGQSGLPY